jgi:hypothetical protein
MLPRSLHVQWAELDGEPLLPEDPFHNFGSPSGFDPDSDWLSELSAHSNCLASSELAVILDVDAETNNLPPGLLDSPSHQETVAVDLQRLCEACVVLPLLALLATPIIPVSSVVATPTGAPPQPPLQLLSQPASTTPSMASAPAPLTTTIAAAPIPPPPVLPPQAAIIPVTPISTDGAKRHSVRLASYPQTSADPIVRARKTKLKKLGLTIIEEDAKEAKKQQVLLVCLDHRNAEEAIADLLGLQAQQV